MKWTDSEIDRAVAETVGSTMESPKEVRRTIVEQKVREERTPADELELVIACDREHPGHISIRGTTIGKDPISTLEGWIEHRIPAAAILRWAAGARRSQ